MPRLGVNIDHVATLRQARREPFPDPVVLAAAAQAAGADGITAHLREDRRHIQDDDIRRLAATLSVPLNLEMSVSDGIVAVALAVKPAWACLVPEQRRELTTEGGLDVDRNFEAVRRVTAALQEAGTRVSFFIEAEADTVAAAQRAGADAVELHTGPYATAFRAAADDRCCSGEQLSFRTALDFETGRIEKAAHAARAAGLVVNAGHGLDFSNVGRLVKMFAFDEFNIGFSIVARALEVGMEAAVKDMKERISTGVCAEF